MIIWHDAHTAQETDEHLSFVALIPFNFAPRPCKSVAGDCTLLICYGMSGVQNRKGQGACQRTFFHSPPLLISTVAMNVVFALHFRPCTSGSRLRV